ncbi:MAG: hypothetical protein AAF805_06325 [Planctomycetota bacterium]
MARFTTTTVAALVVLRLLCGWHFYNEGVKKLDGGFTAAGFLRTAKGPFAPLFESMAPGPHRAYETLTDPLRKGSTGYKRSLIVEKWQADYGKRSAQAAKAGEAFPTDFPEVVSFAPWLERMSSSWDAGIVRLARLGLSGKQIERVLAARDVRLGQAVNYLHGQVDAIADLRHDAWRLQQLRERSGRDTPPPYERELIEAQKSDLWRAMQPIVRNVQQVEDDLVSDALAAAGADGVMAERIEDALAERTLLSWVDFLVVCVVLGSGVCLFLGFGTRLAAIAAAGFLFSLILTQPPWVAGSDLQAFFTWAIEAAALGVLASTGAGNWLGVDGLFHRVRTRFGDLAPPPSRPAPRLAA